MAILAKLGLIACVLLAQADKGNTGVAAFTLLGAKPLLVRAPVGMNSLFACPSAAQTQQSRGLPTSRSSFTSKHRIVPTMVHAEHLPSLPAMVGTIGGMPLLPGGSQVITSPSPGQSAAMKTALAVAAVDDRLGGKPVLAYFSSSDLDQSTKGIATVASIEEIRMDDEGVIEAALVTGVGRAVIPRVRNVDGKPLLVADKWNPLHDEPPAASYMHALEMIRPLENDATAQHNERRRMLAKLTATSVDLQLCDLDGVCNTEMLLDLGPEVYSKAQELIALAAGAAAGPERSSKPSLNAAVTPLRDLALKGARRVEFWDGRWPQFGDDVDAEMRYLRSFSFACWQALRGVVSKEEYAWALSCTDTMERMERATEKIAEHKAEIAKAQQVLEMLQSLVRRET